MSFVNPKLTVACLRGPPYTLKKYLKSHGICVLYKDKYIKVYIKTFSYT